MKKVIEATITYVLQDATHEAAKGRKYEIMDSDGFRQDFVNSEADAILSIREAVEDQMGLSSGVALGNVKIVVLDMELTGTPVSEEDEPLDVDGNLASTETECAIHGRRNCGTCC